MAWALASGRAVIPHALKGLEGFHPGVVRGWERSHESQVVSRQFLCRTVSRILRSPRSVRGALALLKLQPRLAAPLMRYVNATSL
jgi:hypothetical protein